jgi:hypothetical protein
VIITQALLFKNRFRIVEAADEQVEFDKFSFHKTILSLIAHLLPLLLIRIDYSQIAEAHNFILDG